MHPGFFESAGSCAGRVVGYFASQVLFSAVLTVVVLALTVFLRNRHAFLAAGLWSLVFVRLVLPAGLSAPFSVRTVLQGIVAQTRPANVQIAPPDGSISGVPGSAFQSGQRGSGGGKMKAVQGAVFAGWLAGFAWAGISAIRRFRRYRGIIDRAESLEDAGVKERLEKWKRLFRIRRPVRLVCGAHKVSPFTMGILKPAIYLPRCLIRRNNRDTIESVIAHEMAHIRYADDAWIRLQNLIQAVYFFNPAVWLAGRRLHQAREQFRDAEVLSKRTLTRKTYGSGLLNVVRMHLAVPDDLMVLPNFANEKERLFRRIQHIKHEAFHGRAHVCLSCLLILSFAFFMLPMAEQTHSGNASTGPVRFGSPIDGGTLVLQCGKDWNRSAGEFYFHKGIDVWKSGGPVPVKAAAAGTVVSAGQDEIFNRYREITVQHEGGYRSRYLHLDSLFVRPGQDIQAGQAIGRTPACVHFEILKDGKIEDPEQYLDLRKRLTREVHKD
jgi:beta-lactamase regulating signal transducer with metallopeptidase domain